MGLTERFTLHNNTQNGSLSTPPDIVPTQVQPPDFFNRMLAVLNGAWRLACLVVFMYAVCAFQTWRTEEAQRELTGHIAKTLISQGYKTAGNLLKSSKALCSDPTLQDQCMDYLVSHVEN